MVCVEVGVRRGYAFVGVHGPVVGGCGVAAEAFRHGLGVGLGPGGVDGVDPSGGVPDRGGEVRFDRGGDAGGLLSGALCAAGDFGGGGQARVAVGQGVVVPACPGAVVGFEIADGFTGVAEPGG